MHVEHPYPGLVLHPHQIGDLQEVFEVFRGGLVVKYHSLGLPLLYCKQDHDSKQHKIQQPEFEAEFSSDVYQSSDGLPVWLRVNHSLPEVCYVEVADAFQLKQVKPGRIEVNLQK